MRRSMGVSSKHATCIRCVGMDINERERERIAWLHDLAGILDHDGLLSSVPTTYPDPAYKYQMHVS